jgi:hypothetical protein
MNKQQPHHVTHKYMIAAKMSREGYPRKAIAEYMGVTVWQVNCYLGYAKKHGISALPETDAMILKGLQPKITVWLNGQIPDGGSIGDVVRAILTDSYYEENPWSEQHDQL